MSLSMTAPTLRCSDRMFPILHEPSACTVSRDRFERLVSAVEIPASPETIWAALTEPSQLVQWLAACHGSIVEVGRDTMLDFEDGEFFLVRTTLVDPRRQLQYMARWLGIGQASSVAWTLEPKGNTTHVTVTEEAINPPWDWQTWNGGGWPGILDQLAAYLRTGTNWRWPWRRMGPYAQIELPISIFAAWDTLFHNGGAKYWLLTMHGSVEKGATLPLMMGDASGIVEMTVDEVVHPGEKPPSFLPYVEYRLRRPAWGSEVPGRLWLEPAGWGRSLLQAFHYNWEGLPGPLQLSERRILAAYWSAAARRAAQFITMSSHVGAAARPDTAPHNW